MTNAIRTSIREELLGQGGKGTELPALQQHQQQLQLRLSDLRVQLGQLQEQKDLAAPKDKARFNQQIADLQHEETVVGLDLEATKGAIALLRARQQPVTTIIQRPRIPVITRREAEWAGVGAFLLMLPLVIALARRIWVRGGQRIHPILDVESSPRFARLEEAVDAIAIEVERIGEGQRFAARLLSERAAEPMKRVTPPESPGTRHSPGTITPH